MRVQGLRFIRYIYIIISLSLVFIWTVFTFSLFYLIKFLFRGEKGHKWCWHIGRAWFLVTLYLGGIWPTKITDYKVNKDKNYIFIANHSSFLDTPMIGICGFGYIYPLANKAFSSIPFFGKIYKEVTVIVDRKDNESRVKSIRKMEVVINRGDSIWIFPEGKMNETDDVTLLPFRNGAFKLSLLTNTPLLPVIYLDTKRRWNPKSFWSLNPGRCRAVFLPEILPNINGLDTVEKLKDKAFKQMKEALEKYQ